MRSRSLRWAPLWWPLGLILAITYLAGHTLTGRDGLLSFVRLQEQERSLTADIARLEARKADLQRQIARSSVSTLDRDFLEERARALFNGVRPGEVIMLVPAG